MCHLVIDMGNTRTKIAVFKERKLIFLDVVSEFTSNYLEQLFSAHSLSKTIVSSVKNREFEFEDLLKQKTRYIKFSTQLKTSVINQYKSINTLGLDRLAAIIGAQTIFPDSNCLVIDAGTCITYDAISSDHVYSGGSISLGLNMRFKALNTFTGKLPLIDPDESFNDWKGNDTRTAILSGVLNGIVFEMSGFINKYITHYQNLKIILCGGDANFFGTRLKNSIFVHTLKIEPQLVLIGLNEVIYQQND
ncbi:MAG: type III pantothenate kinase [Daejeonella sp.]